MPTFEERYVLTRVYDESETSEFQEDSYEEALTETEMLEMFARRLGYVLVPPGLPVEWLDNLRHELLFAKATRNFTFSRAEVVELLGGHIGLLLSAGDPYRAPRTLAVEALKKLIAEKEPDYDPSFWNQAIERSIFAVNEVLSPVLRKKNANPKP